MVQQAGGVELGAKEDLPLPTSGGFDVLLVRRGFAIHVTGGLCHQESLSLYVYLVK